MKRIHLRKKPTDYVACDISNYNYSIYESCLAKNLSLYHLRWWHVKTFNVFFYLID